MVHPRVVRAAGVPLLLLLLLLIGSQPACCSAAQPSTGSNQTTAADRSSRLLRQVGTLGLLVGAIESEAAIEGRLERLLRDLAAGQPRAPDAAGRRLDTIRHTLERAQLALEILGAGLELAAAGGGRRSTSQLQRELRHRAQVTLASRSAKARDEVRSASDARRQLEAMRRTLAARIERTVRQLEAQPGGGLGLTLTAQRLPQAGVRLNDLLRNGLQHHIKRIWQRRQDREDDDDDDDGKQGNDNENALSVDGPAGTGESQSSEAESSEEAPGGLVGLIAGLSGGDEGSDVGALIGSLSAVVTNLFGPGGLDVPGLLGTGTSLLAGLLGGDDNFGKVLGSYVGIAVEGLSGGGADLNGAFFGNFLGALLSYLSSDPEDENLPLKPKLFVRNFVSGLEAAKRKQDPSGDAEPCCQKGSDLFGFLGNIVSSVVGGITSLVLNASLGSSGGSSQGATDASGASSSGSSGDHPASTSR